MMKCRFYSKYVEGFGCDACSYDKVINGASLLLCTQKNNEDNCACFEPVKCEKESSPYAIGSGISNQGLVCTDCERIIFVDSLIGASMELDSKQLSEFDWIEINGIRFQRI